MTDKLQAVVLAAGYGRRMRPLSNTIHKTLLEINGKSILSNIVQNLVENGIKEITFVLGYQAQEVENHLRQTFPELPIRVVVNENYATTNNLVSLSMGISSMKDDADVIIIESDLIFEKQVLSKLIHSDYKNVALVDKYQTGMDGTVVTISDNRITGIIPPHLQGSDFDFEDKYKTLNIYKFSREFCFGPFKELLHFYTDSIHDSYYELILGVIIYLRSETVYAEIIDNENWAEIDDPNDLQIARYLFEDHKKEILDRSYGGFWNYPVIDFCYLRNMYFPPPSLISELKNNLDQTLHEYGSAQSILNKKMSYFLECDESHVMAVNGISQLFPFMKEHFQNKSVLIPNPTFGDYSRVFPEAASFPDQVGISTEQFSDADQDVIVFVNPNNPTGTTLSSEWIFDYAKNHPNKMIVVDESFIDFSDQISLVELLKERPLQNIVVITSLSKCMGIAGLRIGYCYTNNSDFMHALKDYIPIWNMNTIAENFMEILLKYRDNYRDSLSKVKADREEFIALLKEVPFFSMVYPSGGDFILVQTNLSLKQEQKICNEMLSQHNIYLKQIGDKFDDDKSWLRIAVRLPGENRKLTELFNTFA